MVQRDERAQRACLGLTLAFCLGCNIAASDDAPAIITAATAPPVNGDLDLYTDYVARGLTYNRERLALQGRFEYDSPSGPYLGFFFNNNTFVADKESVEIDPYIGYIARTREVSIDVGAFGWTFPNSRLPVSDVRYDTLETYLGVTYHAVGVKFWYELTNYFGLNGASASPNYGTPARGSSRGSHYTEANVTLPVSERISLGLHLGHEVIRNYDRLNYTDWRVGLEGALGHGCFVGLARSGTNADAASYTDRRGLNLARGKWVGYFRWAFP